MNKIYNLAGYFLLGMSAVGLIAYSCQTFDRLRGWGQSLGAISLIVLILLAITDDAMINYLKITRLAYLGIIIGSTIFLLVGVLIQWQ
jgi:hypothetical protein